MTAARIASILLRHLAAAAQAARAEIDELEGRPETGVLNPAQAAAYLGISKSQLLALPDIPCKRLSDRIVRYSERELLAYIESGRARRTVAA